MKRFGGKRTKPGPVMNVTPLVDIVLVLLIIFMVVLPNMENDAPVEIPSISNVDEDPRGRMDPVTVSITRDARLFLEQDELSSDRLETELRAIHQREPTRRVILRGDMALEYGPVRDLFRMCQHIGFPGVSLRVNERGARPSGEG